MTPSPEPALPAAPTLEDWASWEGRWELIDGVPFDMTPAPGLRHQDVALSLASALLAALKAAWAEGRLPGVRLQVAPVDCFLPSGVVEPDLALVTDPARRSGRGLEGPPDLVVEVLSPRTAAHDRGRKLRAYERAGVPEYLMVDPGSLQGVLLRLVGGRYREVARPGWCEPVPFLEGRLPATLGDPDLPLPST